MISEKDCIVSDDRTLSEIFKTHFINITKTLNQVTLNQVSFLLLQVFLKLLKLLNITLALRIFVLCEGRSVNSFFILLLEMKLQRLF